MDDDLIHGLNMAAPQFFLHHLFGFWFDLNCHTSNLASSGVRRKLWLSPVSRF